MTRGERIKHLREEVLKLSQEALAEALGVSRGAVGNWERGGDIKGNNLLALAKLAGSTAEWIDGAEGAFQRGREDAEAFFEQSKKIHSERMARVEKKQMDRIRKHALDEYGVEFPADYTALDAERELRRIRAERERDQDIEIQEGNTVRIARSGPGRGRRIGGGHSSESINLFAEDDEYDPLQAIRDVMAAGRERSVNREGVRIDFAAGGIRELDAAAGLGGGQTIPEAYRPGEGGFDVVDAFKPEPWIFPAKFTESLGAPASKILAIATQGESMSPTIHHGDVVFVDTTHVRISPPGLYAMRDIYGEVIVKRLDVFRKAGEFVVRITSDNPHEPSREELAEEVAIVGRVCGIMKRV